MRAGDLNRKVDLYRPTTTENEYGEAPVSYDRHSTRWARVTPTGSSERSSGGQIFAQRTYEVSMRWFSGLERDWQLEYQGNRLDIDSLINVDEADTEWLLTCVEVLS